MAVTGESENRHWGYPVLVNPADSVWCLISEANIERRQSASSLRNDEVPSGFSPEACRGYIGRITMGRKTIR